LQLLENLPLLVEAAESDIMNEATYSFDVSTSSASETELAEAALQLDVNNVTFDVDMSTSSASESQLPSLSTSAAAAASPRPPSLHQSPPGSPTQISFAVDETIDAVDTASEDSLRSEDMVATDDAPPVHAAVDCAPERASKRGKDVLVARPRASNTPSANGNWHLCLLFTIIYYAARKN